jgi:hypothetical protein
LSFNAFYKQLESVATASFPNLSKETEVAWDYLVSPLEIKLPKSVLHSVDAAVKAMFKLSRRPDYAEAIQGPPKEILNAKAKNHSVLMAYDFHTTEAGDAALVEINTNASGYMFASLMEACHGSKEFYSSEPIQKLQQSFFHELELFGKKLRPIRAAVVDEDIPSQKMYPEFVMYRELFKKWGWTAEIVDSKDLQPKNYDLIYNRLTDFYLDTIQHLPLKTAYLKNEVCLTPQPKEYGLLADKQRLVELGTEGWLEKLVVDAKDIEAIRKILIPTYEAKQFGSPEEIWEQRKSLFFKPKNSFGAKSVYRGESVSRKVFERLMHEDVLIQKFVPAQRVPTEDPRSVLTNWKFDLRCFVYEDQIQMCAARIYQGQVTNFASQLGGFTSVVFV